MSSITSTKTQYAWGIDYNDQEIDAQDVTINTDEYEFLIEHVFDKIKEEYKDDETCRFYSKLLGKLLNLANQ